MRKRYERLGYYTIGDLVSYCDAAATRELCARVCGSIRYYSLEFLYINVISIVLYDTLQAYTLLLYIRARLERVPYVRAASPEVDTVTGRATSTTQIGIRKILEASRRREEAIRAVAF